MKYRTIGTDPKTRREVSVLALGAMLFGSVTDEKTSFWSACRPWRGWRRTWRPWTWS
jgi:aryl-alcohol dehydrogenase-like predicted oxidoreductase